MGRLEKRPENQRSRNDLSRSAENALWDMVEDLENLQQNVLRALQDDVKRLEGEKSRLAKDIERLTEEKEKLQQTRQISEQQVLIRQLAEVLSKHISSQLQSSLKILVSQAQLVGTESSDQVAMKWAEVNAKIAGQISENITEIVNNLDNNLTIAFSSLQEELKNYQSHLSQQFLKIYDQQRQGEQILTAYVSRLQTELDKAKQINSQVFVTGGSPTVLQLGQTQHRNGFLPKSPEQTEQIVTEPIALATESPQEQDSILESVLESSIVLAPQSPPQELSKDVSAPQSSHSSTPELILDSTVNIESPPEQVEEVTASIPDSLVNKTTTHFSVDTIISTPYTPINTPINTAYQEPTFERKLPKNNRHVSSLQIGFLWLGLYTIVCSLYNVIIRAFFWEGSQLLGEFQREGLLLPTLGNIFLLLMLRLLVVLPLMLLLGPTLHPPIWQELKNLFRKTNRNNSKHTTGKQLLILSVLSGGCLFLSELFIYVAISQLTVGVAMSLFFVYPLVTGILAWFLLSERPSPVKIGAIFGILGGQLFILSTTINTLASISAILSGIAFGSYVIISRLSASAIHPISFGFLNFATMLLLSFLCLLVPLPADWNIVLKSSGFLELLLGAFMLAVLTLSAWLLKSLGTNKLGSHFYTLFRSFIPISTVVLAGLMIRENLDLSQMIGVILVTGGTAVISWEKMHNRPKITEP
ncbi:DMT family transporter [Cylindrospermopsis curvispora]|uniref:EamA family transporter n=1 Tax=Cylindrospermopsis curvispora GIHE-G1 TaxID=2666332 RepID=A0A7H0F4D7_9CYAN|nr:DMT family transporter [Cylindrospermopsis curvispora]QNP30903.1 EamA family transporter [Cylindrospermopsis curvispora GIHE-G1]